MASMPDPDRIVADRRSSAVEGCVKWAPAKSLWLGSMTIVSTVLAPLFFSWEAVAVFLATSAVTLCFGHSVGMHRRLIHHSFDCPRWLEHFCVYLGTLVGMAGPLEMIRIHDHRDWAQRQPVCHDYFCHRSTFWRDAWWQLHCRIILDRAPVFQFEQPVRNDRFYAFVEKTWMLQQIPLALILMQLGGVGWAVWGICVRVAVCVTGHWLVGYFAHRKGDQVWVVEGAAAQGYNVSLAGLISMGESWHNNHHAFPGSAKFGLLPGQLDPGWWLICAFQVLGLAGNIVTPDSMPYRAELRQMSPSPQSPYRITC